MVRLRLLVSIAIVFLERSSRCNTSDNNRIVISTTPSKTSKTTEATTTATTTVLPSLCGTCSCSDKTINCTKLGIEHHFKDSQWPSTPIDVVTFEGNDLIHLQPFPNVTINRLILRDNRITKIEDKAFREIRNLTELDLSHNQLTSNILRPQTFEGKYSPNEYEPLSLRVLNLANNALHTLKPNIFEHVVDLRVLILSGNPLTTIDVSTTNAISELLYLEELVLSNCELTDLPDHFFHALSQLKRLSLGGNRMSNPPNALEDCRALEYLNLDENPFELMVKINAFPHMPALKELSLCCMPHLTFVGSSVFSKLTALEHLRVQNCPRLKEIDEDALVERTTGVAVWPPLKTLDISDNALRYLPAGLVGRWDHLVKLDLIHNEWSCDCNNQYLIGTLLPSLGSNLMGKEIDSLKCTAPPEHLGKNLTSLAHRKLRCLDRYDAHPERDAAILVGIMIGLLLAIPVALTFFVFWRKGFFFCGSQGPASFSRAFYKRTANDDGI